MNSSIETRLLGPQDLTAVEELVRAQPSLLKVEAAPHLEDILHFMRRHYLNEEDGRYLLYGGFDRGELVLTTGMYIWSGFPYWTLTNWRSKRTLSLFGADKPLLAGCMNLMLDRAESHQLFKFYFLVPRRGRTVGSNQLPIGLTQRLLDRFNDYEYYTETIIRAGTAPSYKTHSSLVGSKVIEHDLVVRFGSLKEEKRNHLLLGGLEEWKRSCQASWPGITSPATTTCSGSKRDSTR